MVEQVSERPEQVGDVGLQGRVIKRLDNVVEKGSNNAVQHVVGWERAVLWFVTAPGVAIEGEIVADAGGRG